jgi:hypothetical protein
MLAPSRVSTGQEGSTRRICNAHAWTTQASAPAQPSRKSGGDVRVAARLVGLPPARPPPPVPDTRSATTTVTDSDARVAAPRARRRRRPASHARCRPQTPAAVSRCTPPTTHRTRHTTVHDDDDMHTLPGHPDSTRDETRRTAAPRATCCCRRAAVSPCRLDATLPAPKSDPCTPGALDTNGRRTATRGPQSALTLS